MKTTKTSYHVNIFDKGKKIDSPTNVGKQIHILVSLPIKNLNLMSPDLETTCYK